MTLEALVEEPADCTASPYTGFAAGAGGKRAAGAGSDDGEGGSEEQQGSPHVDHRGPTYNFVATTTTTTWRQAGRSSVSGGRGRRGACRTRRPRRSPGRRRPSRRVRGLIIQAGLCVVFVRAARLISHIHISTRARAHAHTGTFFWGGGQGGGGGGRGGGGQGGRPPRDVDPTNTTVYVGGLPPGYTVEQLKAGLSHYGGCVHAVQRRGGQAGCCWSFGWLTSHNKSHIICVRVCIHITYRRRHPRQHAAQQGHRIHHLRGARAGQGCHREPGCVAWRGVASPTHVPAAKTDLLVPHPAASGLLTHPTSPINPHRHPGLTLGLPGGGGVKLSWSTSQRRDNGSGSGSGSGSSGPSPPPTGPSLADTAGHYGPAVLGPPSRGGRGEGGGGRGRGRGRGPRPPMVSSDDESSCWFCVGSPKAELELLVTIGEGLYVAVPKVRKSTSCCCCCCCCCCVGDLLLFVPPLQHGPTRRLHIHPCDTSSPYRITTS